MFTFNVKIDQQELKGLFLLFTAQLFNPHFTKPVFTKKKIPYMQELWKLKFNWIDTLLDSKAQSWVQFTNSLKSSE